MRTDTPTTRVATVDRLRAEFARARRRFKSQRPALRWTFGVVAVVTLVALAYAATGTQTAAVAYVHSGERFAADDLLTVRHALDRAHLRYRTDDQNRVEVAADQLDAANDAVSKLGVGPRPISAIEEEALKTSPFDSISVTQQRQEWANNAILAEMIRPMDGVVSARVRVYRPRPRTGLRPVSTATAFVWVETDKDRELSSATVDAIQGLIAGAVPEVKHDAVSVFDHKGRHYSDAQNPARGAETKIRHRQDELRQEILDKLDWLKGVTVSVQLVASTPIPPPNVPLPPLPTLPAPPADDVALPPTSMSVNQPLELPSETYEPSRTLAPAPAPPVVAAPPPVVAPVPPPRAKVWVKVPRSYYLKALPNREPSLDDLQPFVERTRGLIETAVRHVVAADQLDEPVVISTIPDAMSTHGPSPAPRTSPESRRLSAAAWWIPAGIAVAAMGGGLAVVLMRAAQRPALRSASATREDHGRYKIDEASGPGPGPSERVRELIRLNPEAAASVLHRWTGQGGTAG